MKVITFSRKFPAHHPKAGQPTYFVERVYKSLFIIKIVPPELASDYNFAVMNDDKYSAKHHTIRAGHRWKQGEMFSPRVWSGRPYFSKQIEICKPLEIVNVIPITILVLDFGKLGLQAVVTINGKLFEDIETLAKNDGLELNDLLHWFMKNKGTEKEKTFEGQIIIWNKAIHY